MNTQGMIRSAQVIQQMLKDVGINAKLTTLEVAQYFNRVYRFNYQMALHVTTVAVDPEELLVPYFGDVATSTYYKWSNKEIWEMIKRQSTIMDRTERAAYIREIQRKILADYPVTFLFSWRFMAARWPWYHRKRYQNTFQTGTYEETWLDLDLRKKLAGR
jgi:peptide/nickel transport system substrate-binding protein